MANQSITVSYDSTNGFTFQENGAPLPGGAVTVDTRGTSILTFSRAANQSWTFKSFSIGVGVQASSGNGTDSARVGIANNLGSSFSWTVTSASVPVTNQDQVPQGQTYAYEYSFVIDNNGTSVPCDPKIYNRIG